jgi:hypothetical protein
MHTLTHTARMTLHDVLADLGFPSVHDMPENAPIGDYYRTIADAWGACDQTDDDAAAIDSALARIRLAFGV